MPVYTFNVRRSGNLAVPCSVPWQLEGVGLNPIPAAAFPGGVLPSGVADFAAGVELAEPSFELLEGDRPTLSQTGRLILRNPVDCKLDPNADRHALTLQGGATPPPPPGYWEPIPLADLPDSRRTNISSGGTLNGDAGENFVLTSPVTGGTITLKGTGKPDQEIVLRGNQDASDAAGLRAISGATIVLEGDYCCLGRLVLRDCRIQIKGDNCSIARCEMTNVIAIAKRSDDLFSISGSNASVHKNDFTDRLGDFRAVLLFKTECIGARFNYNLFSNLKKGNYSDSTFIFYVGSSEDTTNIKTNFEVRGNLFINCDVDDIWECKVSEVGAYDNTIEGCGSAGFRTRHGRNHRYRRNQFIRANNAQLITARTGPHEITENQFWTESGEPGGGTIALWAGKLHWDYEIWKDQRVAGQENNWQATGNCLVVANFARVHVGVESGTSSSPAEVRHGYFADGNNVGPTSGASRNRVVDLTPYQKNTKRDAVPGYDIQTVLPRLTRGAVGLRAP